MDDKRTFYIEYEGTRFENASLPLDMLSDLTAFRDLIVSMASREFFRANPRRKRLPKGFRDAFRFSLDAIENGSAVPRLRWTPEVESAVQPSLFDGYKHLLDMAYEDVVELFDASRTTPVALSKAELGALNRFGASLSAHERIRIPKKAGGDPRGMADEGAVVIDINTRRRLITSADDNTLYNRELRGTGNLFGMAQDNTIFLQTGLDTPPFLVPLSEDLSWEYFNGHVGQEVQYDLVVSLNQADEVVRVISVVDISLVEENAETVESRLARLDAMADIAPGWLDGHGDKPSSQALAEAKRFVEGNSELADRLRLYPRAEGGVTIEFTLRTWDFSLEVDQKGEGELFGVDLSSDRELEPTRLAASDSAEFNRLLREAFEGR